MINFAFPAPHSACIYEFGVPYLVCTKTMLLAKKKSRFVCHEIPLLNTVYVGIGSVQRQIHQQLITLLLIFVFKKKIFRRQKFSHHSNNIFVEEFDVSLNVKM
jgi:hypothetical protein